MRRGSVIRTDEGSAICQRRPNQASYSPTDCGLTAYYTVTIRSDRSLRCTWCTKLEACDGIRPHFLGFKFTTLPVADTGLPSYDDGSTRIVDGLTLTEGLTLAEGLTLKDAVAASEVTARHSKA